VTANPTAPMIFQQFKSRVARWMWCRNVLHGTLKPAGSTLSNDVQHLSQDRHWFSRHLPSLIGLGQSLNTPPKPLAEALSARAARNVSAIARALMRTDDYPRG